MVQWDEFVWGYYTNGKFSHVDNMKLVQGRRLEGQHIGAHIDTLTVFRNYWKCWAMTGYVGILNEQQTPSKFT